MCDSFSLPQKAFTIISALLNTLSEGAWNAKILSIFQDFASYIQISKQYHDSHRA